MTHAQGSPVWADQRCWTPAHDTDSRYAALAAGVVVHMAQRPGAAGVSKHTRPVADEQVQVVTTWSLRCRCGRDYRLRSDRLEPALMEARRGGVPVDLFLGIDL